LLGNTQRPPPQTSTSIQKQVKYIMHNNIEAMTKHMLMMPLKNFCIIQSLCEEYVSQLITGPSIVHPDGPKVHLLLARWYDT